ncbi:MAG: BLUF domain-containing protein [Phycisphaerales bacterium]
MLLRYVYVSTARRPMLPEDLRDIATTANFHNARSAVTGLLLYGSMSFIQLIEGPIKLLPLTYARIVDDPRHRSIELIIRERVTERVFPSRSMGVINLEDVARIDRAALTEHVQAVRDGELTEKERGERAMQLLRLFREQTATEQPAPTAWKLRPSG